MDKASVRASFEEKYKALKVENIKHLKKPTRDFLGRYYNPLYHIEYTIPYIKTSLEEVLHFIDVVETSDLDSGTTRDYLDYLKRKRK